MLGPVLATLYQPVLAGLPCPGPGFQYRGFQDWVQDRVQDWAQSWILASDLDLASILDLALNLVLDSDPDSGIQVMARFDKAEGSYEYPFYRTRIDWIGWDTLV